MSSTAPESTKKGEILKQTAIKEPQWAVISAYRGIPHWMKTFETRFECRQEIKRLRAMRTADGQVTPNKLYIARLYSGN